MTINERIEEIIKTLFNGKKSRFASQIGVSPTVIENIVGTRKGNPSFGVLEKIAFAIENINLDWLLTGRGKMTVEQTSRSKKNENDSIITELRENIDKISKETDTLGTLLESKQETIDSQRETIRLQQSKILELEEKLKSNL
ncbi:hypothetical protein N4T20_02255 [Flavobacterium sp. TR2]|uniref:hypothetical protein n=1 Tax=Flavobacterium sp. TR2 TaxID=2977321 RepID=UPI0021B0E71C|nr:hypothetical protein [Flavobacterium sp. TR2]UWY28757.1 hypothetical protein N4T20_02255 [Flavobacterium sp. TR2]